jgi:lantibiotic biosynthesis protein
VLREAIAPVVRGGMERGELESWFFIRYQDPEPHLRVRFRGDPQMLLGKVVPALDAALAPLRADGAVYKVVVDTYVRELERYGGDRGIELVEELFWRDSEAVLAIVELLEGDEGAAARWQLAVRGSESLLVALGLDRVQRAKVWNDAREMLGREHRATTALGGQIGDRFTKERALLEHLFEPDAERDAAHDLEPGFTILGARDAQLTELATELRRRDAAGELTPPLVDIAWSLVHMHANRLLHASHRAQELVIYDFLRRLHAAKAARKQ